MRPVEAGYNKEHTYVSHEAGCSANDPPHSDGGVVPRFDVRYGDESSWYSVVSMRTTMRVPVQAQEDTPLLFVGHGPSSDNAAAGDVPTGGGRSSGGPVDQYVGGRAFRWSAQVDASHILDLAPKPDGELVAGGGEFRERLLDVGSLEPHQDELPYWGLLQSPSLSPASPDLAAEPRTPFGAPPCTRPAKSLPPCSLPGRIGKTPLNTAIGLFAREFLNLPTLDH